MANSAGESNNDTVTWHCTKSKTGKTVIQLNDLYTEQNKGSYEYCFTGPKPIYFT